MPSATGIRSFMLNFCPDMLTSGVTSHPIIKEDVNIIYFINMRMGPKAHMGRFEAISLFRLEYLLTISF